MSRIESSSRPPGESQDLSLEDVRRNTRLGIVNGVLGQVAMVFVHPELVLVGMIYALASDTLGRTSLLYLAAAVTVVSKAGMLGPQLLVGSLLEHRSDKKPTYAKLMVLRAFCYGIMIIAVYLVGTDRVSMTWGLSVFFATYLVVCLCAGSGHGIYTDIIGRVIPIARLGRFIGLRNFLGGAAGFVASLFLLQAILGLLDLPLNYVVLIATGACFSIVAMVVLLKTHAPEGARAKERTTLLQSVRRGFDWIKVDHNYRCYLGLRIAFRINYLGLAFFFPYGKEQLCRSGDLSEVLALTGMMVAAERGSRWLTALFWGRLADRRGFRTCLVGVGIGFLLMPMLALSAPHLPTGFETSVPFSSVVLTLPICVYLLALAAWGAAIQGSIVAGNRFYIGSAPPHRRISYMGFLNTVTSPLTLLPLAGAALAAQFGIETIFMVVLAASLLYLLDAVRMIPEHKAVARRDGVLIDEFHAGGAQ